MRIVHIDIAFVLNNILDIVFAVFLFSRLRNTETRKILNTVIRVTALAALVALNAVAIMPGAQREVLVGEAYFREVLRWLLMGTYIFGIRRDRVVSVLYLSTYWLILYNSYVLITRVVSEYIINEKMTLMALMYRMICMTALLALSYIVIDFSAMENIRPSRMLQISVNAVCLIYIAAEYRFVSRLMERSFTLRYFILILLIFFPVSLLLAEYGAQAQQEISRMRLCEAANEYRVRYYRDVQKSNENIRTLAHDMKNHLLAIRHLAQDGENKKIESYIDDMYDNFGLSSVRVKTGNDLIDSIITKKISDSKDLDIHYSVLLDAQVLESLSDIDICTIFGNALDNAVEACEKVGDKSGRFVSVKSGVSANNAIVEIANSCTGKPEFRKGLPKTSKKDKEMHGFGTKSIKRTVEKYGGMIKIDADNDSVYKLTMLFPITN